MEVLLFAPKEYWKMPDDILDEITGGCGPGGFGDLLIPDTLWGLSISPACRIHDYMYAIGETLSDKDMADRVLLNNMIRIIQAKTRWKLLKLLRLRRAVIYYYSVCRFGGFAYWRGKNKDEEEREVDI